MSDPSLDDHERAGRLGRPFALFMARWRGMIRQRPWLNVVYKLVITVVGVVVIVVGLILVPLPGPGWLIVFIGLTILGSEFHWARRFTSWLRMQLARFWVWWRARPERRAIRREERADRARRRRPDAQRDRAYPNARPDPAQSDAQPDAEASGDEPPSRPDAG